MSDVRIVFNVTKNGFAAGNCTFCKYMNVWHATECEDQLRVIDGNVMEFDSSGGEYVPGQIAINFCPFCGRKLEPMNG